MQQAKKKHYAGPEDIGVKDTDMSLLKNTDIKQIIRINTQYLPMHV